MTHSRPNTTSSMPRDHAQAEDYDGEVEDRLEKLGAELDTLKINRPIV